jgi:hypothetical protein
VYVRVFVLGFFLLLLFVCFDAISYYVAQARLKLAIFMPQTLSAKIMGVHASPHPIYHGFDFSSFLSLSHTHTCTHTHTYTHTHYHPSNSLDQASCPPVHRCKEET